MCKRCTEEHQHQVIIGNAPGHGSRAVISQASPEDLCYEFAEVVFALLDGGVHAENSMPSVSRDNIMPESFSEQGALPSVTADGSYQVGEIIEWEMVAEQEVCVLHALQSLRQQGPSFSHDKNLEVLAMPVFQHCPGPADHRNKLIGTQWGFNAMVARPVARAAVSYTHLTLPTIYSV